MRTEQITKLPLSDHNITTVKDVLTNQLLYNEGFAYSIYINGMDWAYVSNATVIDPFVKLIESDDYSISQILVVNERGVSQKGKMILLTTEISPLAGLLGNTLPAPAFSNQPIQAAQTNQNRIEPFQSVNEEKRIHHNQYTKREQERIEMENQQRIELRIKNEYLEKDICSKEKQLEEKDQQIKKLEEKLKEAEKFEKHVSGLMREMQLKEQFSKKNLLDYATDIEKAAPGFLGRLLGFSDTANTPPSAAASTLQGTQQENEGSKIVEDPPPNEQQQEKQKYKPPVLKETLFPYVEMLNNLNKSLNKEQVHEAMEITYLLSVSKDSISTIKEMIWQEIKSKQATMKQKPPEE
jgi:hypothetical protein